MSIICAPFQGFCVHNFIDMIVQDGSFTMLIITFVFILIEQFRVMVQILEEEQINTERTQIKAEQFSIAVAEAGVRYFQWKKNSK